MMGFKEPIVITPKIESIDENVNLLLSSALKFRIRADGCVDCIDINGRIISSDNVSPNIFEAYLPKSVNKNPYNVGFIERSDRCLEFIPDGTGCTLPPDTILFGIPNGMMLDGVYNGPKYSPDTHDEGNQFRNKIIRIRAIILNKLAFNIGLQDSYI